MPPIGRGNSPPPEIRPIADDRPPSPGSGYPHQQYQHHPNPSQPGGIAAGAPPPTAALAAAEAAAARERDDRPPPAAFKRQYEPEDDYKVSNKKLANGESRGRLEDHHHHRVSPPDRPLSPRDRQRRSSSEIRRDDQRRANENYHPSEAAHHSQAPPTVHQQTDHLPLISDPSRDDRREPYEPAARKMEVDEDYDDEGDDEKRVGGSGGRNSPQRGLSNGQPKPEPIG